MRPLPRLAALLLLSACGATVAPPAARTPPSASATPPAPAPVAEPAPFDFALPDGAALTASVDLAKLAPALMLAFRPIAPRLTVALGLNPNLPLHALFETLGVDEARPLVVAEGGVTDDQQRAVATLRADIPPNSLEAGWRAAWPEGRYAAMKDALGGVPAVMTFRILIPATSAVRVRSTLDSLAGLFGLAATRPGEYAGGHALAVVNGDGDVVAVDVAIGTQPEAGLAALVAATARGHATPPPLGQDAVHVAYVPERMAALGFLSGVATTTVALSSDSLVAADRQRLAVEGLWESSQNLVLATTARGARFDRVDVTVGAEPGHPRVTLRAEPGPGFEGPPDDAWAPSFGLLGTAVDVSVPFLTGWTTPGGGGRTALDGKGGLGQIRDAGSSGLWVALPDLAVSSAVLAASESPAPGRPVLARLARFGVTASPAPRDRKRPAATELFVGVLPEGTTRAAAECVLVGAPPCSAKRLAIGRVAGDGSARVKLTQVGGRYVLLRAKNAAAFTRKLEGGLLAPAKVEVRPEDLPELAAGVLGGKATGTARREGRTIVLELSE